MANLTINKVKTAVEEKGYTFTVQKISKKLDIQEKYLVTDYQNLVKIFSTNTLKDVVEFLGIKFAPKAKALKAKTEKAPKAATPVVRKLADIKKECFELLGVNDIKAVKKLFPSTNLRLKDSWLQILDNKQPEEVVNFGKKAIKAIDTSRIYCLSEAKAIAATKGLEVIVNLDSFNVEVSRDKAVIFQDLSMKNAFEYLQAA